MIAREGSFALTTLGGTVYTRVEISTTETNTQMTITAKVGARLNSGGYTWSTGVCGKIIISATEVKGMTTIFGNGTEYHSDGSWIYITASKTINKQHVAQTVTHCYGEYYEYIDGSNKGYRLTTGWTDENCLTVPAKPSYTVSYNANGGSGAPSSQPKWYDETLTLSSTKPTRTNYTFVNWGVKSGSTWTYYSSGAKYTANAAAALKARWRARAYIQYDTNGGSTASWTSTYDSSTVQSNPDAAAPTTISELTISTTVPERTNYTFIEWNTASDGTGTGYAPGESVTDFPYGTTRLYAIWQANTSAISAPNATLGSPLTITVTKGDSSYVDELTYSAGTLTGSIGTIDAGASSISWTPPYTLAAAAPNATTFNLTITTTTYRDATSLGSNSITIKATIPSNISTRPKFVTGTHIELGDANGYYEVYNTWVQGMSRATAGVRYNSAQQYGAKMSSFTFEIFDASSTLIETQQIAAASTGSGLTASCTFSSAAMSETGTRTVKVTAYDTRGFASTTLTREFTVTAYTMPRISGLTAVYDASALHPFTVHYSFSDFTLFGSSEPYTQENALYETIDTKPYGTQSWATFINHSNMGVSASSGGYTEDALAFPLNSHYSIRVTITDGLGNSSSAETDIETWQYHPIIDLYKNKGVALGMVATSEGLMLGDGSSGNTWDLHIGANGSHAADILYRPADSRTVGFRGYNDMANDLVNALPTDTSTPVDDDYYVSQYANGGTTNTTYRRSPVSALWNYIKGKADSVYAAITHYHDGIRSPASENALWRQWLTEYGNVRVDNRATASDDWALFGYCAAGTQAPSSSGYKTANKVFATPDGASGLPSMRTIVADDMGGPLILVKQANTGSASRAANSTGTVSLTLTAPTGYAIAHVLSIASNGGWVPAYVDASVSDLTGKTSKSVNVQWVNGLSVAQTCSFSVRFLCVRSGFLTSG